ncbi:hypothetical protein Tco_0615043, partial [Tanacetum coccineum]
MHVHSLVLPSVSLCFAVVSNEYLGVLNQVSENNLERSLTIQKKNFMEPEVIHKHYKEPHPLSLVPGIDRGGGECGGGCEDKSVCAWEDKTLSAFM